MKLEKPDNIPSLAVSLFFFAASLGSLTAASYSTFCERLTIFGNPRLTTSRLQMDVDRYIYGVYPSFPSAPSGSHRQ